MSNLRPYHAFGMEGNHYVYSVWGMSYRRVSARTIEELAKARDDEAAEVRPETLETIKELGLRWSEKVRCEADMEERDRRTVAVALEKPGPVSHVTLFATQDCNMCCPYCYGDGGGAMTEETAIRAVDWLLEQAEDSKDLSLVFLRRRASIELCAHGESRGIQPQKGGRIKEARVHHDLEPKPA